MSTVLVTRTQFEYSIMAEFSIYAKKVARLMMLTEIGEQELRKFKTINICVEILNDYFSKFNVNTPPTNDDNSLTKSEIENVVQIYNMLMGTNYWYEFPEDS